MVQSNNVPFVDLRAQYIELQQEIDSAIRDVIGHSNFIGGQRVESFEKLRSILREEACSGVREWYRRSEISTYGSGRPAW